MGLWLLLESEGEGRALQLEALGPSAAPPGGEGVDCKLIPDRADQLDESAKAMASLAYRLLTLEGITRAQLLFIYLLNSGPIQARGRSADLAFLLAHIASVMQVHQTGWQQPLVAATGIVDDEGNVQSVQGVRAKVLAARQELPEESIILVPSANLQEIEELLNDKGPRILGVENIHDALEAMGIMFNRARPGCPFRGLEHFGFEHRALFFGREQEIQECLDRLDAQAQANRPGLLVVGPSGSGKSSFMQAGVLAGLISPTLEQGLARKAFDRTLKNHIWRPGLVPESNEEALARNLLGTWAKVLPELHGGNAETLEDAARLITQAINPEQPLLWVIDQLEELFTTHAYPDALLNDFGKMLLSLQASGVWVLASLRDDFLTNLRRVEELQHWYESLGKDYYLKPLADAAGMNGVIIRPAAMAGLEFEIDKSGYSLGQQLLNDALDKESAAPLPLVEFTLLELYTRRKDGHLLTWDAYNNELGGLKGAIGRRAEMAYLATLENAQTSQKEIPARRERALRRLLRSLVNAANIAESRITAKVVPQEQFSEDQDVLALIEALVEARLLVRFELENIVSLRVAHEALLTQWQTASHLVGQDREDLQRLHRLEARFADWQAAEPKQRNDLLLPAGVVAEYSDLAKRWGSDLAKNLHEYVRHSIRQIQRGLRIRNGVIVLLTVLVMATGGAAWWAVDKSQLANQRYQDLAKANNALASKTSEAQAEASKALYQQSLAERQSRIAEDEKSRAEEELKHATSLRLAASNLQSGAASCADVESIMSALAAKSIHSSTDIYPVLQKLADATLQGCLVTTLPGQGNKNAIFSPDGKRIAALDGQGFIHLWDTYNGKQVATSFQNPSGYPERASGIAFSPDGKRIVSGNASNVIYIWDAGSGKPVGKPLKGYFGAVLSVAFSPDGKRIASGSRDRTIRLWDALTGEPVGYPMEGHEDDVNSVAFSPDGKRIVSGSHDKTVRLWDATIGSPIGSPMEGHTASVRSVAFSPDGRRIVSGSWDKTLRLWDASTGKLIGEPLKGHKDWVNSATFSLNGKQIVSGDRAGTLRLWDAFTGSPLGEPLTGHLGSINSVAFSSDSRRIVSSDNASNLKLWFLTKENSPTEPAKGHKESILSLAISPDGKRIVSGSWDKTLRLWDAATGLPIGKPLTGHTDKVFSVAFSPDGKRIVSGSWDKTLRLWDATTGQPVAEPMASHKWPISNVAFRPNGKHIISSDNIESVLHVWDAVTGKPIGKLIKQGRGINSFAISPDGKRIATSEIGSLYIRDAVTGNLIGEPMEGHEWQINSVTISPDGKLIASGSDDKTIRLWNSATGMPIGEPLKGHEQSIRSLAFSPDGKRIVSASDDDTLWLWDVKTRKQLGLPLKIKQPLATIAKDKGVVFSPDGKKVVFATYDSIGIVPVLDGWSDRLCQVLPRNPSHAEWRKFVDSDLIPYKPVCPNLPIPKD